MSEIVGLVLRFGEPDPRAVKRCLEVNIDRRVTTHDYPADARRVTLGVPDGSEIHSVRAYDEAADGSRGPAVTVIEHYRVCQNPPLKRASVVFERLVLNRPDVSDQAEASQAKDDGHQPHGNVQHAHQNRAAETHAEKPAPHPEAKHAEKPAEKREPSKKDGDGGADPKSPPAEKIAAILTKNPEMKNRDVIAELDKEGVHATSSQINKVRKDQESAAK